MTEFLTYDLKVAVLIAVFYMFYRLMLARETFHRVNRIVLLLTAVASYVLPLCVITIHETVTVQRTAHVAVGSWQAEAAIEQPALSLWQIVLPILFIIGVALTLSHTLWSLFRIIRLIKHSEQHPQEDGTIICVTGNAVLSPFSWMHYIVMNRSDYETNDAAILAHERGHIRLHHSWDLILVDTLTALQWFNPAMWMLRSDLRAIHEYEADGAVLSQGINARQYQYLLITKAAGIGGYSLVNGISHSTLKNRINMMLHTKSSRRSLTIKMGDNRTVLQVVETDETKAETPEAPTAEGTFEPVQGDVFDVVEEMPQYPGGAQALLEFLNQNVQYPEEAEKAGIQGRVIATFVVEKDGSVSNARVVKSVDPMLDAEALRVINAMPKWKPGKQNGELVRVKYTVPLSFRFDGVREAREDHICEEDGSIVEMDVEMEKSRVVRPLFIVDGQIMDGKKVYSINPKTIERFYMQDGQEAVEKYGEKAKEGVVIITLKKS